ncbi:short-chain fatty acids transporter [Cytobacillus oceanisediminis]|uniref:Short-chain fatty acids transporter n=1 Tax=Cytobacillus oceanisediminis TaxID=665099 RepID=A0A2V2ZMM4_9BACI|nr:TIGR00366 family protein [Cytobacillus oceanisediminis]PWW25551.1 short-chain fatty acids transporter [Cytobacillus oceanisediminis]
MLTKMADRFSKLVEKYLPDAFVIAVLMTLFVFILGLFMKPSEPVELFKSFGDGFWVYLAFTMQMVLLLMTGMALASVPAVERTLEKLASKAQTANQAYVLTFLISSAAYYINWGLAVVVGAIIAREVGKRNQNAHFPLLVAAAYAPTVLYTAGLSSSIGLTVATEGHFLEKVAGVIPTSETIFHPGTITILVALLITIPIFIVLMAPKKEIISYTPPTNSKKAAEQEENSNDTPAGKLESTPFLGIGIGLIGLIYIAFEFINGRDLDLNIINIAFLSLGLILHKSLIQYAKAFKEAASAISPIILQFPFYAGIIAVLGSSGLAESIINGMTSIASKETFDIFTYWTAGLVNILAPSGGGQWALQGPLQVPAGLQLGVDPAVTAMAVGWGDAWTNLIQPFWALPILSVVGLHIRHIMGYCILLGIWVGFITTILMFFVY